MGAYSTVQGSIPRRSPLVTSTLSFPGTDRTYRRSGRASQRERDEHAASKLLACCYGQFGHAAAEAPAEPNHTGALCESRGAPSARKGRATWRRRAKWSSHGRRSHTGTRLRTFPHTGLEIGIGKVKGTDGALYGVSH